jgi:hypothetical protein
MSKQNILYIVRGLPGSGKSTFGLSIEHTTGEIPDCFAADDYFVGDDGVYRFDRFKLPQAHAACQVGVQVALASGSSCIVANTFTQRWEMQPYLDMARHSNARIIVVDCYDGGMTDAELAAKNVHGVTEDIIASMRYRWEHDWRAGDPRAPWERG